MSAIFSCRDSAVDHPRTAAYAAIKVGCQVRAIRRLDSVASDLRSRHIRKHISHLMSAWSSEWSEDLISILLRFDKFAASSFENRLRGSLSFGNHFGAWTSDVADPEAASARAALELAVARQESPEAARQKRIDSDKREPEFKRISEWSLRLFPSRPSDLQVRRRKIHLSNFKT